MIKQTKYRNYLASSDGKILSKNYRHTGNIKELSVCYTTKKYLQTCLFVNGKDKHIKIHRLIAETFIPNPNNFKLVHHINGIKTDNRIENLMWCNNSYNQKQAYLCGAQNNQGEKHPNNKLTVKKVVLIRTLLKQKVSQYKLAKQFNVTQATISCINRNISWCYPECQIK